MKLKEFFDNIQLRLRVRDLVNDDRYVKENERYWSTSDVKNKIENIKVKYGYVNNLVTTNYKEHISKLKKKYLNQKNFQPDHAENVFILNNENDLGKKTWKNEFFFPEKQESVFYRTLSIPKLKNIIEQNDFSNAKPSKKSLDERSNYSIRTQKNDEIEKIFPISKRIKLLQKKKKDINKIISVKYGDKVNNEKTILNFDKKDSQIGKTINEVFFNKKYISNKERCLLNNIRKRLPKLLSHSPKPKINIPDFFN